MKLLEGYCVYPDTEIPSLLKNDKISKLLTGLSDGSLIDLIRGVRSLSLVWSGWLFHGLRPHGLYDAVFSEAIFFCVLEPFNSVSWSIRVSTPCFSLIAVCTHQEREFYRTAATFGINCLIYPDIIYNSRNFVLAFDIIPWGGDLTIYNSRNFVLAFDP